MNKKTDLRHKAKALRKTLDMAEKSSNLCHLIRNCETYKSSKNVMLFYPLKDELDLTMLLEDNKNFYLPRVNGENLEVCPYKKGDELKKSNLKIYEPVVKSCATAVLDLVIVPALLVDKSGYRLGYGGGYYDRFLEQNKGLKTLCAIPEELVVENIPTDEFDIKMDYIISA